MTAPFAVNGWDIDGSTLTLSFSAGGQRFTETVTFPGPVSPDPAGERILDLLAIVAGVSYAKAFAPATVGFPALDIDPAALEMVRAVYDEGMREFAHENALPLSSTFTVDETARAAPNPTGAGTPEPVRPLIPFGGGRDSCVVASALRRLGPTLFTVGDNPHARAAAQRLGLRFETVTRTIDPALLALNAAGAPNGHVPVTAINSLISVFHAHATGHDSVVMANEKSASMPTRTVDGIEVNHQYSKSAAFENLLARALSGTGTAVAYASVLRGFSDADIARAFAHGCTSLHDVFMSCNRAMVRDPDRRSARWCGGCPKCFGVFLSLAPFMSPEGLTAVFGADLLAEPANGPGFRALMSSDQKPFECVADVDEARASLRALVTDHRWSDHVVVRECRSLAENPVVRVDPSPRTRADSMFRRELESFMDAGQ